jgi:nicotinic acid mononucleotide adenylyltransferase
MERNYAAIEVKSELAADAGVIKDLRTLKLFRTALNYERAIYLIYGYDAMQTAEKVEKAALNLDDLPTIEIWIHSKPSAPCERRVTVGKS